MWALLVWAHSHTSLTLLMTVYRVAHIMSLKEGTCWCICYEYVVDDCHCCCVTVGGRVLCFARRRFVDTYTACDCSYLGSRLVVDWQKTVEIVYTLLFLLVLV